MKEEDKKKCDELWKGLEQQIRSLCLAKLRYHPHEVDDIIAQAFLALCQRVDTDGFPDNPKAWIYGTCRNLIAKKYNEIYDERRVCLDKYYSYPLSTTKSPGTAPEAFSYLNLTTSAKLFVTIL